MNEGKLTPEARAQWAKVALLAERLGVQPVEKGKTIGSVLLQLPEDGPRYDVIEMVHAFLDRMEQASA